MIQPDLFTLDHARQQADAGMTQAIDHAAEANPEWPIDAYHYLVGFAQNHQFFISEDVSGQSKLDGLEQPPTDRAWGSIYRKAVKHGIIVQDGIGRSARRHASICPRWRSLICK